MFMILDNHAALINTDSHLAMFPGLNLSKGFKLATSLKPSLLMVKKLVTTLGELQLELLVVLISQLRTF
jgi:hypothetical protein